MCRYGGLVSDVAAFQRDVSHLSESGSNSLLHNLEQPKHTHVDIVYHNIDKWVSWVHRSKAIWTIPERRPPRPAMHGMWSAENNHQRHSKSKCVKCSEMNHVTAVWKYLTKVVSSVEWTRTQGKASYLWLAIMPKWTGHGSFTDYSNW